MDSGNRQHEQTRLKLAKNAIALRNEQIKILKNSLNELKNIDDLIFNHDEQKRHNSLEMQRIQAQIDALIAEQKVYNIQEQQALAAIQRIEQEGLSTDAPQVAQPEAKLTNTQDLQPPEPAKQVLDSYIKKFANKFSVHVMDLLEQPTTNVAVRILDDMASFLPQIINTASSSVKNKDDASVKQIYTIINDLILDCEQYKKIMITSGNFDPKDFIKFFEQRIPRLQSILPASKANVEITPNDSFSINHTFKQD
jgi:hypothetical protein